jgi:transposase
MPLLPSTTMRCAFTDEIWAFMGSTVESCKSHLGSFPDLPDRMLFEADLYRPRVGCPWRDLPSNFGDRSAVYNRLRGWIDSGRMKRLFEAMAAQPACEGTLSLMIDSSIVRVHQHAAGALKKKRETSGNAIGRFRCFSTNIIALATDEEDVVDVDPVGTQRYNGPLASPVLAEVKGALGRIDEVLGDKAIDSDKFRIACLGEHDAPMMVLGKVKLINPFTAGSTHLKCNPLPLQDLRSVHKQTTSRKSLFVDWLRN